MRCFHTLCTAGARTYKQSPRIALRFGLFGRNHAVRRWLNFLRQAPEKCASIFREAVRPYDAVSTRTIRPIHHTGLHLGQHSCQFARRGLGRKVHQHGRA